MKKYATSINPGLNQQPSIPLEPCPFCGSEDLCIGWAHALAVGVVCLGCRSMSRNFDLPSRSSKRNIPLRLCVKAAKAWNQRHQAPSSSTVALLVEPGIVAEYRSSVSGLWYESPSAAGDVNAVRVGRERPKRK